MSSGSFDIDQLVGPEGFKQVDVMNTKLDAMVEKCIKVTETAEKMTAAFGKPGTGGGGLKGQIDQVEELASANDRLAKANTDLAKEIAIAKEALRQQNTENRLAAKEALALESSQAKMEAQLDQMRIRYKKMTESQRENTAEGKKLLAQIEQLSIKVKELDGRQGVYTKHVGDYKNQMKELAAQLQKNIAEYNALSAAQKKAEPGVQLKNNIMQMGHTYRELAVGTSTAASSMLSFEKIIQKAPTEMDKVAKGVSSVWSVIRQAAYILPGLGIAGIIGIATEGVAKLVEMVSGMNNTLSETEKELMKVRNEAQKSVSKEIENGKLLLEIATNTALTYNEREKAYKELQGLYPEYLQNMTTEEALSGGLLKNYDGLAIAIENTAKKRAQLSALEEAMAKQNQLQAKVDAMKGGGVYYRQYQLDEAEGQLQAQKDIVSELRKEIELQETIRKGAMAINDEVRKAQGESYRSGGKNKPQSKPKAEKMKAEKDNHDQILKWLEEETEAAAKADWAQLQSSLRAIEELRKQKEWEYQQTLDYIQGQMDAQERMHRHDEEEARKAYEAKMKYLNATNELIQASTSALDDIGAIMHEREMMRLDEKEKALKEYYDNELRYIDESGMSEKEKAKARKKLDAENAAQQKQIERDRITSMRKQAQIQKALDIASLIGSTTIAVMSALGAKPYTPLNIFLAAGAGAKGAIELAKLIATPLPQYYVGRTGGPAELARVSERGQEAKVDKHGNFSLLPNRESVVFLNEGDSVLTAEKTRDILSRASYAHLSAPVFVSNSTDNSELLAKQEEQIDELRGLRHDLRAKNLSATFNNYGNFYQYKEGNRL